jgi:NAD(P)-dependent dehydrogenase (short-subunit alcohol dehydrogenase family)
MYPALARTRPQGPNDVADLITFLCREESGYITGVTYDGNGGAHIH